MDVDTFGVRNIVLVRPGERIPVDGEVVDGSGNVDERMVAGESVPAVMVMATLTVLVCFMVGPHPALTFALVAGVSVLNIACPCAMGLATPTSITVGSGRTAEICVLFRKGDVLQELADADVIALEKTGTVTEGNPTLTDVCVAEGVDRRTILGQTALYAAVDGKLATVIAVVAPVKAASGAAIPALQKRGFQVAMITSDKRETADAIALETGIDHVIASVLPDGKVAALDDLRTGGCKVAFVGDKINDAPALAHADVSIAIGTGTDAAIDSADVVLMSVDLRGVVNAVEVSKRTVTNIRQNLIWAFG